VLLNRSLLGIGQGRGFGAAFDKRFGKRNLYALQHLIVDTFIIYKTLKTIYTPTKFR
jgi:hypothetical protein